MVLSSYKRVIGDIRAWKKKAVKGKKAEKNDLLTNNLDSLFIPNILHPKLPKTLTTLNNHFRPNWYTLKSIIRQFYRLLIRHILQPLYPNHLFTIKIHCDTITMLVNIIYIHFTLNIWHILQSFQPLYTNTLCAPESRHPNAEAPLSVFIYSSTGYHVTSALAPGGLPAPDCAEPDTQCMGLKAFSWALSSLTLMTTWSLDSCWLQEERE